MWDIYGQPRNLSGNDGSRNIFLVIVKFHKMSHMSHRISYRLCFQREKIDYRLWNFAARTDPKHVEPKKKVSQTVANLRICFLSFLD